MGSLTKSNAPDAQTVPGSGPVRQDELGVRYDFRRGKRTIQQFYGSWVDGDSDPDYDPSGKVQAPKTSSATQILREYLRSDKPRAPRPPQGPPSLLTARRQGFRLPLVLRLGARISPHTWANEKGRKVHQVLENTKAHYWPREKPHHNTTELSARDIKRRRLRSSTKASGVKAASGEDSGRWSELTLGHPERRGCKACYAIGAACALVQGHRYPCPNCVEEGEECELVAEPLQKRACGECSRRRVVCSFRDADDHRGPCANCRKRKLKCVAGPKSGYTRFGPCLSEMMEYFKG